MLRFSRLAFVGVAASTALLWGAPPASQALLVYSASGPNISGSLGGIPFSQAAWSLTATADEALAQNNIFSVPTLPGKFDLWSLPVSPKLKILTMASLLEADLLPTSMRRWLVLSGKFPVGPTPKIGFVFTTPFFNPETAAGLFGVQGSYVDLKSPISFAGPSIFEAFTFPSSAGPLVISFSSTHPGTFRIDPVPVPLPALGVAGAFSWSRKLRRRLARQAG
ncbi:MAG: hypothetical protein ACK6DG_09380 [Cyanobacteriota bacterium]